MTVENVPVHEAEDDCAEEGEDAGRADDQQRPAEGGVRLLGEGGMIHIRQPHDLWEVPRNIESRKEM